MSENTNIDSEIIEQKTVTVSFSKPIYGRKLPRAKRAPRAIKYLRERIARHWDVEEVTIDEKVNEYIFRRGLEYPPRRITVKITKTEDDSVEVFLA